jgi:hypothetical protein
VKVYETSNRIGNLFADAGIKKSDNVALFMENRPEYVCTWLGLCKVSENDLDFSACRFVISLLDDSQTQINEKTALSFIFYNSLARTFSHFIALTLVSPTLRIFDYHNPTS